MDISRAVLDMANKSNLTPTLRHAQETLSPFRRRVMKQRISFYRQFAHGEDALVYDIGANMGNRSEAFLRLGARVVAIEPQPQCIEVLARRFGRNPRFTLLPLGLDEISGRTKMTLSSSHVLSSMSKNWTATSRFGAEWLEEIDVPVTTLDAVMAVHGIPNFCKIDVEGYEPQVLRGTTTALPSVSIEFNPALSDHLTQCLDQLETFGNYKYAFAEGENMKIESLCWLSDRAALGERLQHVKTFGDVYAYLRD